MPIFASTAARPRRRPLAVPLACAAALAACAGALLAPGDARAQDAPPPPSISIRDAGLRFGERLRVSGRVAGPDATRVVLQHRRFGDRWRALRGGRTDERGRFALRARVRHSGRVRVVVVAAGAAAGEARPAAISRTRRITVQARLARRGGTRLDVLAGSTARVRGRLSPTTWRRKVVLERRQGRRWRRIATTWTDRRGRFTLRHRQRSVGTAPVRVRFAGDRANRGATRRVGSLSFYVSGGASWYALYGNRTACGQMLGRGTLGVAHRSLPCGTRVRLKYGRREVTVPVIDRGPFVGGRDWDLTGATKRALGFGDVGRVWAAW